MPSPLAATLHSNDDAKKNRSLPGGTITFAFSRPPRGADEVEIDILQGHFQESTGNVVSASLLATFKGRIRNGRYIPGSAEAFRRKKVEDMRLMVTDGSTTLEIGLMDPSFVVIRNELQITVRGKIKGKTEFFQGKAALFVYYPLAMLVPTLAGRRDPALDTLAHWATQWQGADRTVRHVHRIAPLAPPSEPSPRHYNPLISAFTEAAKSAPGGIVALAIGHGDGGQGAGLDVAWCDLMPEDVEPQLNPDGSSSYPHTLFANKTSLLFGHIPGHSPAAADRLVLNALDRIGDALASASTPIRKLLLHTCNVGNDATGPGDRNGDPDIPGFTQLFADRVRVPVQAHTDTITYTGDRLGAIEAHYESSSQRSKTEWPLSLASDESLPGRAPKRFPPPR